MSMSFKASPDGTYGEILVNGQVVAKLPVSGNAVIPGLVGTVSESGGIPTGAVVERGNNANGAYVRFADGTQICLIVSTFTVVAQVTWTFPASFVGISYLSASTDFSATPGFYLVESSTASLANATIYRLKRSDLTATTDPFFIRAVAIGRWF